MADFAALIPKAARAWAVLSPLNSSSKSTLPFVTDMALMVGRLMISNFRPASLFASTSMAATVPIPFMAFPSFSHSGARFLQWPHHGAKNLTKYTPSFFITFVIFLSSQTLTGDFLPLAYIPSHVEASRSTDTTAHASARRVPRATILSLSLCASFSLFPGWLGPRFYGSFQNPAAQISTSHIAHSGDRPAGDLRIRAKSRGGSWRPIGGSAAGDSARRRERIFRGGS